MGAGRRGAGRLTVPTAGLGPAHPHEVGAARSGAHPPPWLVWIGLSAVLLVSMVWRPADDGPTLCPFRALTGLPCPGCGMTRGFCALGHGDLRGALDQNILSPALYVAAIVAWAGAGARMTGRSLPGLAQVRAWLSRPVVGYALLAGALAWWAIRLIWGL